MRQYCKSILLLWLILLVGVPGNRLLAKDMIANGLLSVIKLAPDKVTMNKVTDLLGKPTAIEESGKKTKWIYESGLSKMMIHWENNSFKAKKISYDAGETTIKKKLDYSLADKLKSGVTDIMQAIKIFGLPDDLAIKESTQEMHYTFDDKILRLFFRNRVLVDFTLY